jgi:integrase
VTNAEPKSERYDLFDTKLTGFGVRVTPNGVKTFFVAYRSGDGGRLATKCRLTLGKFGVLTADEARSLADTHLSSLRFNADPVTAKAKRRATITLGELAQRFLTDHVNVKRKPTTAALYADVLNRIVLPEFGKQKVDGVSRADFARLHAALVSTPFQANRMLAVVGSMYGYGDKVGLVPDAFNPTRKIDRYKEEGRDRFLKTEEIMRLGDALHLAETDGIPWVTHEDTPGAKHLPIHAENRRTKLSPHATAALRLLILTGARLREILNLRWSEVDLENQALFLADSKTGRKTIRLSDAAIAILSDLPRLGDFVIAGEDPKAPRSDLKRPWAAVSKAAGLAGVRLHDLRHTYASIAAKEGVTMFALSKLLGHATTDMTQRYAHFGDDPLREATNAVGVVIGQKLGTEQHRAANDDDKSAGKLEIQ